MLIKEREYQLQDLDKVLVKLVFIISFLNAQCSVYIIISLIWKIMLNYNIQKRL